MGYVQCCLVYHCHVCLVYHCRESEALAVNCRRVSGQKGSKYWGVFVYYKCYKCWDSFVCTVVRGVMRRLPMWGLTVGV